MKKINGNWYHNFEKIGFDTKNNSGYQKNQEIKEPEFIKMLDLIKDEENAKLENILELFASDGYYSFLTYEKITPKKIDLVDLDAYDKYEKQFNQIIDLTKIENLKYFKTDVNKFVNKINETYDLTICFGGLYHIKNPFELIEKALFNSKYIIIQTVVPSHIHEEDYFVTPAPGWEHGCRFSVKKIKNELKKMNCDIVYDNYNTLEKTAPPMNLGSFYCLIKRR